MDLIEFDHVTKKDYLEDFDLTIASQQKLGIKLSHEETMTLFDLIQKRYLPTDGSINCKTDSLMIERKDNGLYEKMKVKAYLSIFKRLADNEVDIYVKAKYFFLQNELNKRIETLSDLQKELLKLFRMSLFNPDLIMIESPMHDFSIEESEVYTKAINNIRNDGITAALFSSSVEELLLLNSEIYQMIDGHLTLLNKETTFKLSSHKDNQQFFFEPKEIDFVESINGISHFKVQSKYYPTNLTMNQLEQKLNNYGFYRCHRSYLVNLNRISEITNYAKNSYGLILNGPQHDQVPLSRTKVDEIKHLLKR